MHRVLEWCRRILLKWLLCLYEMLCVGPVLLFIGALLFPEPLLWQYFAYPAGLFLGGLLIGLPLKKSRVWLRLLLSLAGGVVPAYYLFEAGSFQFMAMITGVVAVYRGSRLTHVSWEEHYPLPLSWFGLGLYLIASFLFSRSGLLMPYRPVLSLAGIVFLVTTVFMLNHRTMQKAAHSLEEGAVLPRRMMKQNRWIVALLAAVVLIIGLFDQLRDIVADAGGKAVRAIIAWLLSIPASLQQGSLAQNSIMEMLPPGRTVNPFWQQVLDILLYVVGGALSLLLAAIVLTVIVRGLRSLFRAVLRLLGRRSQYTAQGYIDKRESLWDMRQMAQRTRRRTQAWFRARFQRRERWADMTDNRERIRFLYRRYVRQAMTAGFHPDPAATAAETIAAAQVYGADAELAGQLAKAYQQARYGRSIPSDADITGIKASLDRYA